MDPLAVVGTILVAPTAATATPAHERARSGIGSAVGAEAYPRVREIRAK
jgi:hypothetical protein